MSGLSGELLIRWPGGSQAVLTSPSSSILDAALAAGVPIPHSCLRSDCLQCSAFVVASDDSALEPGSRVDLCQTSAARGGVFELSADPYQLRASAKMYPAKVVELASVGGDTMLLRLLTPRNQVLGFQGGQYAAITLGSGLTRKYSIAGVASATREVSFYIRMVQGGQFSQWLGRQAKNGDMVRMQGPYGDFVFKGQPAAKTLFLATGTGIVPILAMLEALTTADLANSGDLHVVWGNRVRADLFLQDRLDAICTRLGVSQTLAFSRESDGQRMRVTDVVRGMNLAGAAVYAAGNPEMVRDIRGLCVTKGVNPRFVHSDAFTFDRAIGGEVA